tara:strand:+ start:162 stop:626 length:465 start_codon:yes stop_codon:yes gene_type:complete
MLNVEDPGGRAPLFAGAGLAEPTETLPAHRATIDPLLAEGAALWSIPLRVSGYDEVRLLIDYVRGGAVAGFVVAAQYSYSKNEALAEWFDYYTDEATPGTLVRKTWTLTQGSDAKVTFSIPAHGVWVRFRIHGLAGLGGTEEVQVWASRHMLAP